MFSFSSTEFCLQSRKEHSKGSHTTEQSRGYRSTHTRQPKERNQDVGGERSFPPRTHIAWALAPVRATQLA